MQKNLFLFGQVSSPVDLIVANAPTFSSSERMIFILFGRDGGFVLSSFRNVVKK